MKPHELIKLLKKAGWEFSHHGGDHDFYIHPDKPVVLIVPRHKGKELATGTVNKLLKAAGIK